MEHGIFDLTSVEPGIMRDLPTGISNYYTNLEWCRFYNNLPEKIGGRKLISSGTTSIIRNTFSYPSPAGFNLIYGRSDTLSQETFSLSGVGGTEVDRTPSGFVTDPDNIWNFDAITTDISAQATQIVYAHAAPNLSDINNTVETIVYYGEQNSNSAFVPVTDGTNPILANGGLCVSGSYLLVYTDGKVMWSDSNNAIEIPNTNYAYVAGTKIVQGLPINGGGVPAALFWTSSKLIKATFNVQQSLSGTTPLPVFNFENVPGNISILSQNSVVSVNNSFYWPGNDKNFYIYNGALQTLPNTQNKKWFFKNLNDAQRNKVWGMYISENNEIWWHFPYGTSTECNKVIILNLSNMRWYDSSSNRSCGVPASNFPYPIMCDSTARPNLSVNPPAGQIPTDNYGVWQHEYGYDEIFYKYTSPITSFFTTKLYWAYDLVKQDRLLNITRLEPDFLSEGQLICQIDGRPYTQSSDSESRQYIFDNTTGKVDLKFQARFVSFTIISNTIGGYYQAGRNIINYQLGDMVP